VSNKKSFCLPTYGEQFFDFLSLKFPKKKNAGTALINRCFSSFGHEELHDVITYPHVSELFALQKIGSTVDGNYEKFLRNFASQKFLKRSCKKIFDHYNANPLLKRLIASLVLSAT
jgi:hypothetical protein